MRRWLPFLNISFFLLLSWAGVAALSLRPRPGSDFVAVVFPLWWSAPQAFGAAADADAAIVRNGILPAILVVRPADRDGLARLRAAGAWIAIDPQAAATCFTK